MIYVGIDWADDHHDVAITDDSAKTLSQFQISHDSSGFAALHGQLAKFRQSPDQILIALETSRGLLVHELLRSGYSVYAVNPKAVNRYKDRYVLSKAKSDALDALVDKEGYLLELGRYIQLNPVRAGLVRRPEDYRWSSYREYMDGRRQGGLTDREDTLGFFSKKWALAVRKYRDFVKEGIKRGSPLEEAVGSVLGDEGFKRRVMGYLKGLSNVGEIPDLRRVIVKPKVEEIIAKASEFYRVSKEDLLRRRKSTGRERSVTIYLCKVLSGRKNSEIGKFFGIAIQAVTNAVRKMERLRQVEKKLAKEVDSIKEMLIIQSV